MTRIPLLVLAALLLGAGPATAAPDTTICVDDICVCIDTVCPALDLPLDHCVQVDVDGDGDYETICI